MPKAESGFGRQLVLLKAYLLGGNGQGLSGAQLERVLPVVVVGYAYGGPKGTDAHDWENFGISSLENFLLGGGLKGVTNPVAAREILDAVASFASPMHWA